MVDQGKKEEVEISNFQIEDLLKETPPKNDNPIAKKAMYKPTKGPFQRKTEL